MTSCRVGVKAADGRKPSHLRSSLRLGPENFTFRLSLPPLWRRCMSNRKHYTNTTVCTVTVIVIFSLTTEQLWHFLLHLPLPDASLTNLRSPRGKYMGGKYWKLQTTCVAILEESLKGSGGKTISHTNYYSKYFYRRYTV